MFPKFVNNCGLHQYVLIPTRICSHGTANTLDLVFSNMYNLISDLQVKCPFSTSDHNMLKFSVNLPRYPNTVVVLDEYYFDYKNADYILLSNYIDWLYEFRFVFNTEDYWNVFFAHLYFAVCSPQKKTKSCFRDSKKMYSKTSQTYLTRKPLCGKNGVLNTVLRKKSCMTHVQSSVSMPLICFTLI